VVGPRAGLAGCGKSRPNQVSIPRPASSLRDATDYPLRYPGPGHVSFFLEWYARWVQVHQPHVDVKNTANKRRLVYPRGNPVSRLPILYYSHYTDSPHSAPIPPRHFRNTYFQLPHYIFSDYPNWWETELALESLQVVIGDVEQPVHYFLRKRWKWKTLYVTAILGSFLTDYLLRLIARTTCTEHASQFFPVTSAIPNNGPNTTLPREIYLQKSKHFCP
jgi:hypothetical protein